MCIRTLLVDDSPETLEVLRLQFSLHPEIEVCGKAATVAEALDFCARTSVDMVVADIQLRHESGFALCRQLLERHPDVFVTMCSVEDSDENREFARQYGAQYFLSKPLTMHDVNRLIEAFKTRARCSVEKIGTDGDDWLCTLITNLTPGTHGS